MAVNHADPWPRGRARDGGIDEIPLDGAAGRLWLCGKHVVGPDPETALARVDATSILCFCERHELADRYPDYVTWLDTTGEPRARWFPTPDLAVRPLDDHLELIGRSVERLRSGERLVAHCAAGIGRSGTFAVGVLLALGHDLDPALQLVARHRPMAGPEVGSQSELVVAVAGRYRADGRRQAER